MGAIVAVSAAARCRACDRARPLRPWAQWRIANARSVAMSGVKILVAQGGGPTAVINQSLVGVVLESRRFKNVERVYGARHGVRGIINEDLVDLTQETV